MPEYIIWVTGKQHNEFYERLGPFLVAPEKGKEDWVHGITFYAHSIEEMYAEMTKPLFCKGFIGPCGEGM